VDLHQQIGNIKSKEELADFVAALRLDLEANPEGWENSTLERFLSAMEDWIRSMDQWCRNTGQAPADVPSWRTFADVLYASRMYE
jgi:hypothetical protein